MEILVPLLVALVVFAVVIWVISVIPFPASSFPFRSLVYAIAGIILIVWLLRLLGYA